MKKIILITCAVIFVTGSALAEEFELTVNVVGNGIVDPNGGTYDSGTVVAIETWPKTGHWVKTWTGTDDDASTQRMNTVTMTSDKVVTVEFAPAIIVNKPAIGEIWTAGSTHEIQWSSCGVDAVNILFSTDAGGNWQTIESGVPDTRSHTWQLSNRIRSEQCLVSVVPAVADANIVCIESGLFTIQRYGGPASLPRRRRAPGPKPGEKYGPEFGCIKWKFQTTGSVTASVTIGRKIGRQSKVYIACEDGKLYALDIDTGSLIWTYDVNSPLLGAPVEGPRGTVYVGGNDGKLYAIDKNGILLWTHTTDEPIFSSPVVSPQGQIYICSENGTLCALARDGSELWNFETDGFAALDGSIFAKPTISDDGTVYVAGLYDPNLYALNPEDGAVKWKRSFEYTTHCYRCSWDCEEGETIIGWPFASPVIAPDGTIYMSLLFDTNLYAIEPETGTVIWSTDLAGLIILFAPPPGPAIIWFGPGEPPEQNDQGRPTCIEGRYRYSYCWSKPALAPNGTIYVSFDDDPFLRAVDPDGSLKWVTKLGTMGGFTLTVDSNGLIYAASDDNHLYVVNPEGEEIAGFHSDNWLSHPVIAEDSTIIVSDANNMVWAITQQDCGDKPLVLDVPAEPGGPVQWADWPLSED